MQITPLKIVLLILFLSTSLPFARAITTSREYIDSALVDKTLRERFDFLKTEVMKYNSDDLSMRLLISKEMLKAAEELGGKEELALANYELAYSYEIIGEYDRAIDACFKGLK